MASKILSPFVIAPTCPNCKRVIPGDDVNVASDVAFCRACNLSHSLSGLTHGTALDIEVNLDHPPAGAWYSSYGMNTVIGATHRSLGGAIGALLLGLFWNGIVSVFVVLVLGSTLRHLDVPLPEWWPNIRDNSMGVGMTIFLWLFLTPFILIGLVMIAAFFSCLFGRTEIRISDTEATVFSGIGPVGLRRRFAPTEVKDVRIEDRQWRDRDGDRRRKSDILVETREGKQVKLGSALTEERRKFVASALRRSLMGN